MKDLKTVFNERKTAYYTRSSAIFPVRLRRDTDLVVAFLNYFRIKNKTSNVICNIRIYDAGGKLEFFSHYRLPDNHYAFSARELTGRDHFDGMLEIEFICLDNLRYPFPAVMGFYRAGDHFSAVHSAGRIKNANEPYKRFISEETNFTCKFLQENGRLRIGPFIHVFNGPANRTRNYTLSLRKASGEVIASRDLSYDFPPFASRIIEIAKEFDHSLLEPGFFCSLKAENDHIFPRFVCGNLHYDIDFMEATHSYPVIEKADYCESTEAAPIASFLPLLNDKCLNLDAFVFPTNLPAKLKGRIFLQDYGAPCLRATGETITLNTGIGGGGALTSPEGTFFQITRFASNGIKVPSRINTSYRYSVRGSNSHFSSDIATGTTANVYPPKFTHWGTGIVSTNYHTILLVRNNSHNPAKTQEGHFMMDIYVEDQIFHHAFSIAPESAARINIKDIIPASAYGREPSILHWIMRSPQPIGEAFWISYTDSGAICAEHGF